MFGGVVLMPFLGPAYKATGKFKPWVSGLLVCCMGCQFLEYYSFTTEKLLVVLGFKTVSCTLSKALGYIHDASYSLSS